MRITEIAAQSLTYNPQNNLEQDENERTYIPVNQEQRIQELSNYINDIINDIANRYVPRIQDKKGYLFLYSFVGCFIHPTLRAAYSIAFGGRFSAIPEMLIGSIEGLVFGILTLKMEQNRWSRVMNAISRV